jgi:hypothetical protein
MTNKTPLNLTQTIHAGLGNQLFQLAFVLYACKSLKIERFSILKPLFTYNASRPFELKNTLRFCTRFHKTYHIDILKYLFAVPFFSKINYNYNFYQLFKEKEPFKTIEFKEFNAKSVTMYGYFQNYKYVDNSWEELDLLISHTLSIHSPSISMYPRKSYNVIHIRGGDTIESNKKHLGTLLSPHYYSSILNKLNNGLINIIVTDDENWVNQVIKSVKFPSKTIILGKNKLSSWETLALMSDAQLVLSANSTLSWWGSYICVKRGGQAILPDPWSRDWNASGALIWPNCPTQKSIFHDLS